jgi:hypothetical protein
LAQSRDVAKNYRPRSPKYEAKLVKEYKRAEAAQNYPKMEVLEDAMLHRAPDELVSKYSNAEEGYTPEHAKAAADYAKWYEANRPEVGGVYHVDLPQDYLANMLDYDKPINQHPEQVKALLERAGINTYTSATAGSMIGGQEAHLAKHGIPGMAYDDTTGAGTRNFVVFPGNEDMLNIVQRDKKGGAVHMAGGGRTPKYPWERYEQPKKVAEMRARQIGPVAGAVKKGADYATQLIDKGPSFSSLVGGLVGAVPFIGPDMRKRMEASEISIPTDITMPSFMPEYMSEQGTPVYKQAGIEMGKIPTKDLMEVFNMSDFTPFPGLSNVAESIGYGQMPDPLDLLDAAGVAGLGYGAVKGGIKGGRKAAGALSDLAKSEAGYKLAQKALQYAPAAQPMNVVKPTGGNWLSGSVEQALKPLKSTGPTEADREWFVNHATQNPRAAQIGLEAIPKTEALNKWIDRNLTNYIKKQMATPDDPVRKLAEQGVLHGPMEAGLNRVPENVKQARFNAGMLIEGEGQSELARAWEHLSDASIKPSTVERVAAPEPWMEKADPNTSVYALSRDFSASRLGFDHIVDVLNEDLAAGRIRPEQLNKISMEQAVRRTYEYDQELAAKMNAARASAREGLPVYKEYPEGFRWMELNKPGAFTSESEAMGHSVRGYEPPKGHADWTEGSGDSGSSGYGHGGWEAIKSGKAKVYSLVDKEGQPHVTVEVKNSGMTPEQRTYKVGILAQRLIDEGNTPEKAMAQAEKIYPEGENKQFITQIKGKQNRAPKEDYLPFVQDFVKGGQWSEVGDIKNAGLRRTSDAFNENELNKIREAGIEVPAYATQEEIKSIGNQAFPGQYGDVPYAEGGAVSDAKQRLLDMIAKEPHMGSGGEVHMGKGGWVDNVQKVAKKAKMYSAVEKALEASKRGAGTGMEFANELAKTSGIKKAELVDRGIMVPGKNGPVLNPALTQLPKMSKKDFVSHLNEKYKPPGVKKISITDPNLTDEMIDRKVGLMIADYADDYVARHGDADYYDVFNNKYNNDYDEYFERAKEALSEGVGTKYSKYKLPGGENYRENLYQYENPKGTAFTASHFDEPNVLYHMRQTDRIEPTYTSAQIDAIGQRMAEAMGTKVESLGSGAPILMMRKGVISPLEAAQFSHAKGFQNMDMDVDMSPAQRRALHIEEIQSDWHQKGRDKGYGDQLKEGWSINEQEPGFFLLQQEGMGTPAAFGTKEEIMDKAKSYGAVVANVPDAPLKKNWHEHALKQALMDAAEGDYNQLLITPGAEQAKRFDLSQQIDTVEWNTDTGRLYAKEKETGDYRKIADNVTADNIADYVGKETASKLIEQPLSGSYKQLSGLDLQVGGEGMAGFYDRMVPSYLNDLGKKYGVRVGEHAIEGDVPYSKTMPTLADVQRLAQEMYGVNDIQALSALPVEQRNAINQAFADRVRAEHATKLHSFDITPEMREDILNNGLPMYQRGGEVHMAGGGEVHMGFGGVPGKAKKLANAAKAAEKKVKVEHPLVFPRAAAKTLEDIRPIAQRMAEQVTGEFVKQNPKTYKNPAGKSRKQFERERSIPLETRNVVPERPAPDVNYEDYKGYGLVGVPGDPTMGGVAKRGSLEEVARPTVELTRVGDITPDYPVPLFGGPRYGDENKFWASDLASAVPVQNSVNELAKLYEFPILGKYIKMADNSENFALHNLDALLSIQRPEKLSKAKMAQLTELIRAGSPDYGKFPGFTGFKDPADVLLQAQMNSKLRKHIAETLRKPTITNALGLPNGLDVVAAITHPELRNLETGASGFSVGKMKPGATLQRGESSHPTYDTDIPGSFLGRSRYPTPYEIAFPDTIAYARSKLTPGVDEFSMMKMLGPRERIDQQYIDEMKMYEQLMKQYTGKKKGGLAHTKKVKRHGDTVSN